jgi:hypothetical protein
VNRPRKRRSTGRKRGPVSETAADEAYPDWLDVCGRRMFIVGYTLAGAPYGIFEDEMDDDTDMGECDQPKDRLVSLGLAIPAKN